MKRVQAEFPYQDYWLYIVFHKKENRRMANLILKNDTKVRTTISYARYLMTVNLKRLLTEDEEVDHVDNDCTNDIIDNLQILSKEGNRKKQDDFLKQKRPPIMVSLICPVCKNHFEYLARNYRFHTKNGRTRFNCSRQCAVQKI